MKSVGVYCCLAAIGAALYALPVRAQVGALPAGDSGSSTCNFDIRGQGTTSTSLKFKLKYAAITCATTNNRYRKLNQVVFYAGAPLVNYAAAHPSQFKNVRLRTPNEANFLGTGNKETSFFLVGNGQVKITGQIKDLYNEQWPAITIENGTKAEIRSVLFQNNRGEKFGAVAISRSAVNIIGCRFAYNVCEIKGKCHAPAVYVTEGARATVTSSTFASNTGHQGGAMMITSGALATVNGNTFSSNRVTAYGSPGGAIFHDFCSDPRAQKKQSSFTNNHFTANYANGFGGALKIGSPNGGCNPSISNNEFRNNKAVLTGGAIFYTYCNGARYSIGGSNVFADNIATQFNGQIGYNAKGSKQPGTTTTKGSCAQPSVSGTSKFSTNPARYSPPWFFP